MESRNRSTGRDSLIFHGKPTRATTTAAETTFTDA